MDDVKGGRRRSFYGWGYEDEVVSAEELGWFEKTWSNLFKVDRFEPAPMPVESEIALRPSRVTIPATLGDFCTDDRHERLFHTWGRSVHDIAKMIHRRDFSNPPDVVALPRDEADIAAVLDWCGSNGYAAVPFGGGSSVTGGVNHTRDERYKGLVTIDLRHLSKVLEVDRTSQQGRIWTSRIVRRGDCRRRGSRFSRRKQTAQQATRDQRR